MSRRIAIVEDETGIRENYAAALRRQGYDVRGYCARADALAAFRQRLPDLAIIDIGLGEEAEGGYDLCRELRGLSRTLPIIFLTARDGDLDLISGLRLGADDYLTKSVSLPQLLARIAALFRRVEALRGAPAITAVVTAGALTLDTDRLEACWHGQAVTLTLTEFWLVHALARFPGHVRSRAQLMDEASVVVDESTVTSHVKRVRRKFEALDPGFDRIDTVYGAGYRWRA